MKFLFAFIFVTSNLLQRDECEDIKMDKIIAKNSAIFKNDSTLPFTLKCGIEPKPLLGSETKGHSRHGRSISSNMEFESSRLYIGFQVTVDSTMAHYHGHGHQLRSYIKTVLGVTGQLFRHPSIGHSIDITLVDITVQDISSDELRIPHKGTDGLHVDKLLSKFCKSNQRVKGHHTSIYLTRKPLCRNVDDCGTMGLAHVGTVCNPDNNCAVVRDHGIRTGFILAHEVGHLLNMHHDNGNECAQIVNLNGSDLSNIMNSHTGGGIHPQRWSQCSRHFLDLLLANNKGSCLKEKPFGELILGDQDFENFHLAHHVISEERQCHLSFPHLYEGQKSPGYRPCSGNFTCEKIRCGTNDNLCHWWDEPWADGTPCAVDHWCVRGQCVSKRNYRVVDGGWGEWKVGPCSRTCGGGFRTLTRQCDHPLPQNGGRFCVGKRVQVKSCNTVDCIWNKFKKPTRSSQCSTFDKQNEVWIPYYQSYDALVDPKLKRRAQCKLECLDELRRQRSIKKDKVEDGTRCTDDPKDFSLCVNGLCHPAGCDEILYSITKLDGCGVCGGRDECRNDTVNGFYNEKFEGDHFVTIIPAGAKSIKIRQVGSSGHVDHNNLNVLMRLPHGQNVALLNPKSPCQNNPRKIEKPERGINFQYSGCGVVEETLNSVHESLPTQVDLIVQVYSLPGSELRYPAVSFSYYRTVFGSRSSSIHSFNLVMLTTITTLVVAST